MPGDSKWQASHADLRGELQLRVEELERVLKSCPTTELLTNFAFSQLAVPNPSELDEATQDGQQAYVEYLTLLALRAPCSEGQPPFPNLDLDQIGSLVSEVFRLARELGPPHAQLENSEQSGLEWPSRVLYMHNMLVRGIGFQKHRDEMLEAICGTKVVDEWLFRSFGFTFESAMRCNDIVERTLNAQLSDRIRSARSTRNAYSKAARSYQRSKIVPDGLDQDILRRLANMKPGKRKNALRNLALHSAFHDFTPTMTVSPDTLASGSTLVSSEIASYLSARSCGFGDVDSSFKLPGSNRILELRPFVAFGDRYFVPSLGQMYWGLRAFIEHELNPENQNRGLSDSATWAAYRANKATALEAMALRKIGGCLKGAITISNAKYRARASQLAVEGEVDGVVLWGSVLFLIEAKSAGVLPRAINGEPDRLKQTIERTIGKGQEQLARVAALLAEGAVVTFKGGDGARVSIEPEQLSHVLPILVTLDDLAAYTTGLWQLADSGVISAQAFPWAVLIYDLCAICDLCETPSQLVCFIDRRLKVARDLRLNAVTELDLWGHFLHQGLRFDVARLREYDFVSLESATDDIERYYYHLAGWRRTTTLPPRWRIAAVLKSIVARLDADSTRHRLEAAQRLLDLADDEGQRLDRLLGRFARSARRTDRTRWFSVWVGEEPRTLLVLVIGRCPTEQDLENWYERSVPASPVPATTILCGFGEGAKLTALTLR